MIDVHGGDTYVNGESSSFDMTDPRDVESYLDSASIVEHGVLEDLTALLARRVLMGLADGEPLQGTGNVPAYPYEPPVDFYYFERRS